MRTFEPAMEEDGITVVRVKTLPHHKVNFLIRGISQILLPFQFIWALRRYVGARIDGVIVYSPPLPLAFVGEWLRQRGAYYILNVQDIFPQNAIDLGVLTNPTLVKFFRWMERRAYRWADIITAHSENNRALQVMANSEVAEKFAVLHNWIDVDYHAVQSMHGRDFRKEWQIESRFVALFAGVVGPSQNLDVLLDAAARLRDIPDFVFLIVGDGVEKSRLEARAHREGLTNVIFKPFVSRADYPFLTAAADIGVVTLSTRNRTPVVPGKILGYMASGKAVAGFLNRESDGHEIVRDAQCGYTCVADDLDGIENVLRQLQSDRAKTVELGANGLNYVKRHFTKRVIVDRLQQWLGGGATVLI